MPPFQKPPTITHGGSITVGATGTVWTISASGQVVRNGVPDRFTSHVIELAYKNGTIWQENSAGLWYAWIGKNAPGNYHGWAPGTYTAPVPEARTWIGGGNNHANNLADWSPHGVPQPGDTLTMGNGTTMNLTGNQLAGDALNVDNTLGSKSSETINISGVTNLNLVTGAAPGGGPPSDNVIVDLAANSKWVGGFSDSTFTNVTVNGPGNFANTSTMASGNHETINANVVGNGQFTTTRGHGGGVLEFVHSVGAGQTVTIDWGGYGLAGATVQVDDPAHFHASVNLSVGDLLLEGTKASSYSYDGGSNSLKLFNGNTVVDTLVVANTTTKTGFSAPASFAVAQVGNAVDIFKGSGSGFGGALLPLHA
jgi:hypothetical protein